MRRILYFLPFVLSNCCVFGSGDFLAVFQQLTTAMQPAMRAAALPALGGTQDKRNSMVGFNLLLTSTLPTEFPEIPTSKYGHIIRQERGVTHYNPNFVYELIDDEETLVSRPMASELPLPSNNEIMRLLAFVQPKGSHARIIAQELSTASLGFLKGLICDAHTSCDMHLLSSRIIAFTLAIYQVFGNIFEDKQREAAVVLEETGADNLYNDYVRYIQEPLSIVQKIWLSYALVHNCYYKNKFQFNGCGIAVKKRQRYILGEEAESYEPVFTYSEHEIALQQQCAYTPVERGQLYCHLGYIVRNNQLLCFPILDDHCVSSTLVPVYTHIPYALSINDGKMMRVILKDEKVTPYTGWVLSRGRTETDFHLVPMDGFREVKGGYPFDYRMLDDLSITIDSEIPVREIWQQFCALYPDIRTKRITRNECYIMQNEEAFIMRQLMDMERLQVLLKETTCSNPEELVELQESYEEVLREKTPAEYQTELEEALLSQKKEEYQKMIKEEWDIRQAALFAPHAPKPMGKQTPKKFKPSKKLEESVADTVQKDIRREFLARLRGKSCIMPDYIRALMYTAERFGVDVKTFENGSSHFSIKVGTNGKRIPVWHPHGRRADEAVLHLDHDAVKESMIDALVRGVQARKLA